MSLLRPLALLWLFAVNFVSAEIKLETLRTLYDPQALAKRSFGLNAHNDYTFGGLWVNVFIGSPQQSIQMLVSTQYANTWVFGPGSCGRAASAVCPGGTFTANQSSSYTRVGGNFTLTYSDRTTLSAYTAQDAFGFLSGNVRTLKPFTFQVALNATQKRLGTLGLGMSNFGSSIVPPILDAMVTQGLTGSRLYSIYTHDYDSNNGVLLFDGVSTTAYTGALVSNPIQPSGNINSPWVVSLTGLRYTNNAGDTVQYSTSALPANIGLLNGNQWSSLPSPIFANLASTFNTYADATYPGYSFISCDILNATGYLDFTFGASGPTIQMPFRGLANPYTASNGSTFCYFTVLDAASGPLYLGDYFLRSAYVQYDYDNKVVGMAQANVGVNGTAPPPVVGGGSNSATAPSVGATVSSGTYGTMSSSMPTSTVAPVATTVATGTSTGAAATTTTVPGTATATKASAAQRTLIYEGWLVGSLAVALLFLFQ